MKAKSELKAALEALQVRKPLRLSSSTPTFAPPLQAEARSEPECLVSAATVVASQSMAPMQTLVAQDTQVVHETEVPSETWVAVPTQAPMRTQGNPVSTGNQTEVTTLALTETEVAPSTSVSVKAPAPAQTKVGVESAVPENASVSIHAEVLPSTKVEQATPAAAQTWVPGHAKVGGATQAPERSEAHHAPEQDSAVVLEAQASPKLQHGYTRIPNVLLMRMVGGDLLRSEMQVALLIARLTISYQRRLSPISKAVIERQTGLRGPAVLHALSVLVAKGVIEKIPGDQNRPNQFGITSAEEIFAATSGKVSTPAPQNTPVSMATRDLAQTGVAPRTPAPVSAETSAPVPGGSYFKDIKDMEKYKNKDSFSQLPEVLREYLDELKPARKRESEMQAFRELSGDYKPEDIADCLMLILDRGVGGGGQVCHSPMAFLAKAMGEVLADVESARIKARENDERRAKAKLAEQRFAETEAREAEETAQREQAFSTAFPTEQEQLEAIAELLRDLPIRPGSNVGRMMGISRWWASKQKELT